MTNAKPLRLRSVVVERQDAVGAAFNTLAIADLRLAPGTKTGLAGASGAGKSTLLDVACGLLSPAWGDVIWGDINLSRMPESARDRWRRETVGIVFQDFNLVPELSALENILLPARFGSFRLKPSLRDKASELAARMGLHHLTRRAAVLSRGEQQRVAIARALILDPVLILADEPTASLDVSTAADVSALLIAEAAERGATLLVASHDSLLLNRMDFVLHMSAGRVDRHT